MWHNSREVVKNYLMLKQYNFAPGPAMLPPEVLKLAQANKLYDYIDDSNFYINQVEKECRSFINVAFNLPITKLLKLFLLEATKRGLLSLQGYRLVGGVRANLYNAMPESSVDALIEFMQKFATKES